MNEISFEEVNPVSIHFQNISIMHIDIHDKTRLKEIQKVFSDFYPYLQIRFFRKKHTKYQASPEEEEVNPEKEIGEIRKTHISGLLEIHPLYKVSEVEREFQQRFGLSTQLMQREKGKWVQTTGLDDFTLKELNEISRNASDEFIVSDYDRGFENEGDKPEKLF